MAQDLDRLDIQRCPRCGKEFHCSKSSKCWCYEVSLPVAVLEEIEETYDSCLCPTCLNELSKTKPDADGKYSIKSFIYTKKGAAPDSTDP